MQDIVFYVAAKETCGIVRDSANANNISAPNIVLGVSVCLRMRLFAACGVSTPYPIDALNGIADWKWNMNVGFNRTGTIKLTSDPQSITVHSVTDTVDGNSMSFTEFVIPISEMNTRELADLLGNEAERAELNGELIGYDNNGKAVFGLLVKGFTIWNRMDELGDPEALDLEIATRSETLQMIRDAVSSSAATKQDLLTSANAGTNISIDENGVISNTYSLPSATAVSSGGVMLATAAETISGSNAAKAVTPASLKAALTGSSQIIAHSALSAFQTITDLGTTLSVSLESGRAYKLSAISGNHSISVPDIPAGKYGMDAHLKLFVGETALIHVQEPLILMDALIPNAVNDCVIKFRDGEARMYVEDHDVGYVVTVVNGTTGTALAGSLYYGLSEMTGSYIVFTNTLNGRTCDLGGAVTNGEKRIVGNGYTQTVISGGVSCTSKTTFSNLGMNGVYVLGGTATLGDVFVPEGASIGQNGGRIVIERLTGSGSFDFSGEKPLYADGAIIQGLHLTGASASGNGTVAAINNTAATFSSCFISGNTNTALGTIQLASSATLYFKDSLMTGNKCGYSCGGINAGTQGGRIFVEGSTVSGNTPTPDIRVMSGNPVYISNSEIGVIEDGGFAYLGGANKVNLISGTGSVTLSSGATINLTSSIAPGGGITFEPGGATIIPGGSSELAYTLGGVTVPQIGNTNVVNLGGTNVVVSSGGTAYASGCTFTGGSNTNSGGAFNIRGTAIFSSCTFSGNISDAGTGADLAITGGTVSLLNCNANSSYIGYNVYAIGNGIYYTDLTISGGTFCRIVLQNELARLTLAGDVGVERVAGKNGGSSAGGTVTISSGASIHLTSAIAPGGGITISSGGISIIDSAGSTHEFQDLAITGSAINNLGQILGATVSVPVSSTGVGPWIVSTTLGSSTVSATAEAQELVIDGGLVSIIEL